MEYKAILVEKREGVAVVTINQPKTMNALTQPVLDDLMAASADISGDDEVKVVVLTGTGRAFCAGGDINRFMEGFTQNSGIDYIDGIHTCIRSWANMKKPVIAAVNGAAAGAGLGIMLLCDISIMSEDAKVSCAFINMGLIPDCGVAYFLPRMIGMQRAKELIFTGKVLKAGDAYQLGLTSKVVPADELMEKTMELAKQLAKGPSYALRMSKRMLGMSLDMPFDDLLRLESMLQADCFMTEDSKEAASAFMEKRPPKFNGR